MKKIVIFSGAGVSKESGIDTFREKDTGIYADHRIEDVVTIEALESKPEVVYHFHNVLRDKIKDKKPNEAHKLIARLEGDYDVTIITQNIDSLHTQAGSTKVLHLHGELNKSRTFDDPNTFFECETLNYGDVDSNGDKLRPHTVLFGEMPYNVDEAYKALEGADYLIIVGTSLTITYTLNMLASVNPEAKVYYVDPEPSKDLEYYLLKPEYLKTTAVKGIKKLYKKLTA
jgi:NAD-dependent deacetylase